MRTLSILIPCYEEEAVLPFLREELTAFLATLDNWQCEIVLVDDGSTDLTWPLICDWADADPRVKGISLSRNFGHQAALSCAYRACTGDAAVTMDADLQDPPELIAEMLAEYEKGAEIVFAVRRKREKESILKKMTAKLYYRLLKFLGVRAESDCGDFRLMSRRAIKALNDLPERNRMLRAMVGWIGFPTANVLFDRQGRRAGSTKYSPAKMFSLAADGIISFSDAPLRLAYFFALAFAVIVFIYIAVTAVKVAFFGEELVRGWSSLLLINAIFGIGNLLCFGFIGEYIGRIYREVKQRPLYLINRTTDSREEETAKAPRAD